jgi:hypothetical protein
MGSISIDDDKLKSLLKQVLAELFEEHRERLYDIVAEAVEDGGLARAIKEGEDSPSIGKVQVMEALERES